MGKILTVDDESFYVDVITDIAKEFDHTVIGAANGKEALEKIAEQPLPFMVFLDCNMPTMNGLTFYKILQTDPNYKYYRNIPIIATGAGFTENQLKQFDDEALKPFSADQLRKIIKKYHQHYSGKI